MSGQVPLQHLSGGSWNIEATVVAGLIQAPELTNGAASAGQAEGFEHQRGWLASRYGGAAACVTGAL